jgi:hypothetical protein
LVERSGIGLEEQKQKQAPKPQKDPGKIAENRTKEILMSEKEKLLNKKLEEIEEIKTKLFSLYPDE